MDRNSKRYTSQGPLGKRTLGRTLKVVAVVAMASSLSGCFVSIPPAVQFASYALDAVLYIETDKTMSDHALSAITDQDCAMGRMLVGSSICNQDKPVTSMAIDGDIHTFELLQPRAQEPSNQTALNARYSEAPYYPGTRGMSLEQILTTPITPPPSLAELPQ